LAITINGLLNGVTGIFLRQKTAEDEVAILDKWIEEKSSDKKFYYGRQGQPDDPRDQREAVGDNAMKDLTTGSKNLQRILPNLTAWTKEPKPGLCRSERKFMGSWLASFACTSVMLPTIWWGYETLKKNNQQGDVL
jgi:hypothetical protein